MTLPDSIDNHAAGERIVFAGDPLGQFPTATSLRSGWELATSQHLQESSRSLVAQVSRIAVVVDSCFLRHTFGDGVSGLPQIRRMLEEMHPPSHQLGDQIVV